MRIRTATVDDAPAIAAIYAPIVAETTISFEETPPTPHEIANRMEAVLVAFPWLVAEVDDAVAGYAYATRHQDRAAYRWAANVSVYVAEHARRGGIGRELYAELFSILASQRYLRLYAGVTIPNPASEALHRLMGFEPIGTYRSVGYKMGGWHDVRWYGLALGLSDTPREPILFSDLHEIAQR